MSSKSEQKHTHFGFETIEFAEKTSRVKGVFNSVASSYDRMNDAMSFGLHRLWKRQMVAALPLSSASKVLDLAGGTGDIAFLMQKQVKCDITICDINQEMLNVGIDRATDKNIKNVRWVCGNAESLPFPPESFDLCTIAFGIRNVTDIPAALRSIYQCLKSGGRFVCLEFSKVHPSLEKIYDAYSFHLIPEMGHLIAGDKVSYQYLVESIRRFPSQEAFKCMIEEAGFTQASYQNLTGGVVAIHRGVKA